MKPRAHAGAARQLTPGLEIGNCRIVIDRLGVHAPQDTNVIRNLARERKLITEPLPALAMLPEAIHGGHNREPVLLGDHTGNTLRPKDGRRNILIEAVFDLRLVVQEVEMRGAAGLKQKDDPFGPCRKVHAGQRLAG